MSASTNESKVAAIDETNPVDVLAAAIERVVDKKFHSLEQAISKLEQLTLQVAAKQESAAGASAGAPESKDKEKKEKDGKEKDGKGGKEGKEGKDKDKEAKGEKVEKKDKKEKKPKMPLKEVAIAYKVNCVSDISEVSCTFVIDMKVFFSWTDEKLIGRKSGATINYEEEKGLFEPDIVVSNEHDLNLESTVTKLVNSETGEIKRTSSYKGTVFLLSMNLKSFPFDCQNLQICFKPYKLPADEVVLVPKPPSESAMDHPVIHEWNVLGHCMKSFETDPAASSTGKVYSTVFVTILIRRKYGWFVTNVFVPTAAFLLISWLTFMFGAENRGERNDVSMATLLASIANKYVVCDQIPKVDYRTLLDRYVDCCFLLQVLTMLASAIVYDTVGVPVIGPYVNLVFFLLEFVTAALFHEWMFVRLYNHELDISNWVSASKPPGEAEERKAAMIKRLGSRLVRFFEYFSPDADHDFDDGFLEPNDENDSEHFSNFGASIVQSAATKLKKQALQASIELSQTQNLALHVSTARNRSKLSEAIATKDPQLIKECAVRVIQSSWKARRAMRTVKKLKQEKENFILEMAAVKIQKIFRLKRARRRKGRPSLHREKSSHHLAVELEHEKF